MILIVDDEAVAREMLARILTQEGYKVRVADSGELALSAVEIFRPRLILLDLRMPGMSGLEVCRRLKSRPDTFGIPVIILTAASNYQERIEAFRAGAVDFVSKPFERDELVARVRTHFELSMLRAGLEVKVAERTAELRESEERFRKMADAAPVMIWTEDKNKRRDFVNKRWLEFTESIPENSMGDAWLELVHPEDRERLALLTEAYFKQRRDYRMEYRVRRPGGTYGWVLGTAVPRFAPDGSFAGYIGSCVDITELKQIHERMAATQKTESLGLMAAGVAHDFGNLTTSLLAEADLALTQMEPDSPGRDCVERVAKIASHAAEIVTILIASSGAGMETDATGKVDLSRLVGEMLQLRTVAISRSAVIRTDLSNSLPLVRGSVAQLRQVIMNLLQNASEALGGQAGLITVTTREVVLNPGAAANQYGNLQPGEFVSLKVSDTGCGMSAEARARIFDQFFTTKAPGRGLGLAAVHGIIRAHGGAIMVESEPGAGATFEVLLPGLAEISKKQAGSG